MNIFSRTSSFLKDVVSELKKVRWPNRKELVSYTTVVVLAITFLAVFMFVVDFGISELIGLIIKK
ncbi:preprotein translocase subunit SecE [Brevibacillus laterosporus]|uniref:preprotein translocase subunit SecE n=1 Tax=Brevibacillus laterosporus TaxID=1465 RepID=UPI000CE53F19|nr:preprotein translocase subunit SecE [Brevibacillus laterosporus]MBG9796995.1 preprotein translocase subunit SecE [Brevibacillus laterosporus]MCR8939678.1 preprotein translocase subunit SecE [Brevibacillus laterosporus]MCZ0842318.1 preprotein translocase subunit SecE [Brevibacillus laterosporus]MCZ0846260.1 preprotein translocase subunit SecE [Brevibacillus laterosporus]MED1912711.1 preprotein translocase subunit SecE [Brevibacillus laterosporus]